MLVTHTRHDSNPLVRLDLLSEVVTKVVEVDLSALKPVGALKPRGSALLEGRFSDVLSA